MLTCHTRKLDLLEKKLDFFPLTSCLQATNMPFIEGRKIAKLEFA